MRGPLNFLTQRTCGSCSEGKSKTCLLASVQCELQKKLQKHPLINKYKSKGEKANMRFFSSLPWNNLSRLSVYFLCAAAAATAAHKSITAEMCLCDIVVSVLLIASEKRRGSHHPTTVFTLRCLPPAPACLSTTRGSLTYIGSYISGAKSAPQTLSWRTAKSAAGREL